MTHAEPDDRHDGAFADILAGMEHSAEPQPVSDAFRSTLDRMAATYRAYAPAGLLSRLYSDEATRVPLRKVPRSEHEAVAAELALGPGMSVDDLRRIRRAFALTNHPDRVAPALRLHATRRMTIANSLIDKALAERRLTIC